MGCGMFNNINQIVVNGYILDAVINTYEDSFNIVCKDEGSRLLIKSTVEVCVNDYGEVCRAIPIVVYTDDGYILVTPKWMKSSSYYVETGDITFSGCKYARYPKEEQVEDKYPVVDTTTLLYDEVKRDIEWLRRMIRNHGQNHPMTPMFEEMLIKKQELLIGG